MAWPSDFISPVDVIDTVSTVRDFHVNRLYSAMLVMQQIIGLNPLTIEDTATPAATPSTVALYLDMVAALIKAITGAVSWYTAPVTSISDLQSTKISKPSGLASGDIIYWDGSAFTKLHIGSVGKVLGIVGSAPAWVDPSGDVTPPDGVVLTTRQLIMGDGLSIDGVVSDTADLSEDRTLAVAVGANSGLTFVAGELTINIGDGLELVGDALSVDSTVERVGGATDSGLEIVGNVLQIDNDTVARTGGGGGLKIENNLLSVDNTVVRVGSGPPLDFGNPVTDVLYYPGGAANYTDSKINLLNPGTNNARTANEVLGSGGHGEPGWALGDGWLIQSNGGLAAVPVSSQNSLIIIKFRYDKVIKVDDVCDTHDVVYAPPIVYIMGTDDLSLFSGEIGQTIQIRQGINIGTDGEYICRTGHSPPPVYANYTVRLDYMYGDHETYGSIVDQDSPPTLLEFHNHNAYWQGLLETYHINSNGSSGTDSTGLGTFTVGGAPMGMGAEFIKLGTDEYSYTNVSTEGNLSIQAFAIYQTAPSDEDMARLRSWMNSL